MSTKALSASGQKAYGLTMDQYMIFRVPGGNVLEELSTTAANPSMSPPYNSTVRIENRYSHDDKFEIKEMWLDFDGINSAVDSAIFKNEFEIMQSCRLLINNSEVDYVRNLNEVSLRVSNWVRDHANNLEESLAYARNETAYTFNGLTLAAGATTPVRLPMSVLFPFLKNLVINEQTAITSIMFEITFTANYGTAATNTRFVVSTSTVNAYSTNLTYSNIQIRQEVMRPLAQNRKLYLTKVAPKMLRYAHETKPITCDWSSTGVRVASISLLNDFSFHSNCRGIHLFFDDPSERTAYNDAESCRKYSGPGFIGYKILKDGKELIDHSVAADTKKRKIMSMNTQKSMYSTDAPLQVINASDNLTLFYWCDTFIDFQNLDVHGEHESVIAGIPTTTNIEIQVYPASTKGSAVNLYAVLEYTEEITHTKGNYSKFYQL